MFDVLRVFLRRLFRRDRFERELSDELQFHLEARIEHLVGRTWTYPIFGLPYIPSTVRVGGSTRV